MVDRADPIRSNDKDGIAEIQRQVGDVVVVADGGHQPASSFHKQDVAARIPVLNAFTQQLGVDPFTFLRSGQMWCQRLCESLRTNGPFLSRLTCSSPKGAGIGGNQGIFLQTSRFDRFVDSNAQTCSRQLPCNQTANPRFSNAGVGTGNE